MFRYHQANHHLKILITAFATLLASLHAIAQPKEVYSFWKDDSLLKKDYDLKAAAFTKDLINSLDKQYRDDYQKIYQQRYDEVHEMLISSRTVTEAKTHQYLQSIVQEIINKNPELKPLAMRVVFTRDGWPNAYSVGEGTLLINAGLVVFIENEAELAFVLSHEIAHYYLDHSNKAIRQRITTVNSEEFKQEVKRLSKEQYRVRAQTDELLKNMTFTSRHHSRSNEAEADKYALRFMKNTGFDCNAAISCLKMLDRVDDSLLFKPLDVKKAFDFPAYPFKSRWVQNQSVLFSAIKEDDSPLTNKEKDSLKTHPDCSVRIAALSDSIAAARPGKSFLIDEQLFQQIKQQSFFEMSEQEFRNKDLGRNLYYNLILLQQGSELPLAIYSVARDLNVMYEMQKAHQLGEWYSAEKRGLSPDYNQLLRVINRWKLDEIASISYHFCQQYKDVMAGYPQFQIELNKTTQRIN